MSATDRLAGWLAGRDGVAVTVAYGGLVTVVLSFVPFSPVFGGAVAADRSARGGYLAGLTVGLLAGVVAAVPLALLFVPALRIAGILGFGFGPGSLVYDLFLAFLGGFFLVYTGGLSALGGLVGVWVRDHTDRRLDPLAWA